MLFLLDLLIYSQVNRAIVFCRNKIKFLFCILVMWMVISSTTNLVIKGFTLLTQDFLSLIKPFFRLFLSISSAGTVC